MRRVWKKHKDAQANWFKTTEPRLKKKSSSKPTLSNPSEALLPGCFPTPQLQHEPSFTVEDATQVSSEDPAALTMSTPSDSSESPIILSPEYLVVSPRPAAEVSGGESDPFGAFLIPLTPRIHQLICHGLNSTWGHWDVKSAVEEPQSLY